MRPYTTCSEFEKLKFDPLAVGKVGGKGDAKGAGAGGAAGVAAAAAKKAMEGVCPRTGEEVLEGMNLPAAGGARQAASAQAKVGPGRRCSPRHRNAFEPSFLQLNSII